MQNHNLIVLDGGMGRELERMGAPFRRPEWSALALMEAPDTVGQAHTAFIEAGAEIITTNAYAVVPYHIGEERFKSDGARLIELSAKIARETANNFADKDIKVAGCIPPLFGSYRPDKFEPENAESILHTLIDNQADYVDLWIVETISSIEEAVYLITHLKDKTKKPIWPAFSLMDEDDDISNPRLRSEESWIEALKQLIEAGLIKETILFNCSQPEFINAALEETQSFLDKNSMKNVRIGAYANSFSKRPPRPINTTVINLRNDLDPESYFDFVQEWIDSGASIIGGCCGIGPDYIRFLCKNLKQESPE